MLAALWLCFSLSPLHAHGVIPAGPIKALSRYCLAILARAEVRDRATPELQGLLDQLLAVERENLEVTSRYRRAMTDHQEVRRWIKRRREHATPRTPEERIYDAYLERRSGELYADMETLTLTQLDRTRDFEERKAEINSRIAEITGETRARRAAETNRDYARESTYDDPNLP